MNAPGRVVAVALLAASCASGFGVDVPRLVAPAGPIALGAVPYGVLSRVEVRLHNPGTAAVRARLVASDGLRVSTDAVQVPAGGVARFSVFTRPQAFGPLDGAVTVRANGVDTVIPVSGNVPDDFDGDGARDVRAGGDDCDDLNPDARPGATEVCDGVDNDCDERVDVGAVDATSFFRDADTDGFGDPDTSVLACAAPPGTTTDATDCDDQRADVFPGAAEIADGVDQDCNGLIDEHLLVPRSVLITEARLAVAPDAPAYLELRARTSATLYLAGTTLSVDGAVVDLPDVALGDGELLVLCGRTRAGEIDGRPCDGPLPAEIRLDSVLQVVALEPLVSLDLGALGLSGDRAIELHPAAAAIGDVDPVRWCPSQTQLAAGGFGTPFTLRGHCGVAE